MRRRKRKHHGASPRVPPAPPGQWKAVWGPWLRWLGVVIAFAVVGIGLYEVSIRLLDPARFPMRHVHIHGELRNLDQADVRQVVESYLGQNFFALNIDILRAQFATNPWIESVTVRRQWPDTLEVRVRERTAFGYWGQDEMVDVNGKRFRPTVVRQPGPWPRLAGPNGHELNLIRVWREANTTLGKVGLKLVRLVLDQRRAWWMQFDNGVEISLGRENFAQRLQRFVDIYPQVLSSQSDRIAIVDLRYTNGFAVRWKTPPAADSETQRTPKKDAHDKVPPRAAVSANSTG